MRDEQVGEAKFSLQIAQQVDDLRTNAHIQRGDWLVENHQLRPECERTSDVDALALPAGKFMGVASQRRTIKANGPQ